LILFARCGEEKRYY